MERDDGGSPTGLIVQDMCDYSLEIDTGDGPRTTALAHRKVEVGMGTWLQRFECTPEGGIPVGERVKVRLIASPRPINPMSARKLKDITLFSGAFTIDPSYEPHALGIPGARRGRMVQVDPKSFLFIFDDGDITYQCNM